jgi:flavin-dependent dehydrogenase
MILKPCLETEVLIVGSGPAGCAAAITARQAGLNVVLLEARAKHGPVPGETLHPGIELIFTQLGLRKRVFDEGFHRHRGIWIRWDALRLFQPYGADANGSWFGFQVDRSRFGALLVDAARAAGATVFPSSPAVRILHKDGRVSGVGTEDRELRAAWVVDAGGGGHWLAHQLGLKLRCYSPRLIVRFGWRKATKGDPIDPLLSASPDGLDWEAAVDETRVAWCQLRFSCANNDAQSLTAMKYPRQSAVFNLSNVTWRLVSECAGPGYFILGDAAAVLDPASSHGVLRAMMSGIKAGHAIAQVSRGFPERPAISDYKMWLADWFKRDALALRSLYRQFPMAPAWVTEPDVVLRRRDSTPMKT